MIFDECVPYPYSYCDTEESLKRSVEWSKRSIKAYKRKDGYGVFGIVQGGMYKDLRERSIQENLENDFEIKILGFLDDDKTKQGRSLNGKYIYKTDNLKELFVEKIKNNLIKFPS